MSLKKAWSRIANPRYKYSERFNNQSFFFDSSGLNYRNGMIEHEIYQYCIYQLENQSH